MQIQKKRQEERFLKVSCERCGFIAVNKCQLDRHHIDGNHRNNTAGNKQTVCSNCHRLLHYENKTSIYTCHPLQDGPGFRRFWIQQLAD